MSRRGIRLGASLALFLLAAASSGFSQGFTEDFDGTTPPSNWTLSAPVPSPGGVGWDFDNTPVGMPGGSTFGASLRSLNYNDGVDFSNGLANSGSATSPVLVVTGSPVTITWQCNYNTELGSTFDQRFMEVIDPAFGTVMAGGSYQVFNTAPAPRTCGGIGVFHSHTVDITGVLGAATNFQIRFRFNSVDSVANGGQGWFVDSLSVTGACADTLPPTTPASLTPADGAIVISPPAVTLAWAASTDTSSCGPSGIAYYVVELDDVNPPVAPYVFTASPAVTSVSAGVLAPGTYYWRVRAVDVAGLVSPDSAIFTLVVEAPAPPGDADGLHVNTSARGAQTGDPGFVDPVIDETPNFSAIYRDPNTFDTAVGLRFQVSADPLFATIVADSGSVAITPNVPKDSRCPDLSCPVDLQRDTVYYWRIQFTDSGGLTGPFSPAQSFRIGDDFEFGVRNGSSHHGRRCFVATAAFGADSPVTSGLASFRRESLERTGAGSILSRWYATAGAALSMLVPSASVAPESAGSAAPGSALGWTVGIAVLALALGTALARCR